MSEPSVRVAHLSTAHPPRDNRIFHKECCALSDAGLDVALIVPQTGDAIEGGVTIYGLPRRSSRWHRMILGPIDAWRALNRANPALVHFHDPELIPMVLVWKAIHRRKAVFDAHEDLAKQVEGKPYLNDWTRKPVAGFARALVALVDRFMDGIVAATPAIARNFGNRNVVVVRNYPWLKEFPKVGDRKPDPGAVVYVGGMSELRKFSTMVNVVERVPGATLLLAGPMDSGAASIYRNLPVDAPIEYMGRLPVSHVPQVLRRANLGFVLFANSANHVESLPTKLFEYMASQIPFVATDFPYWRKLLSKYDCGVFVDVEDEDACVDAVANLLDDPARCDAMGQRGRAAVLEIFNFDADADTLVRFTARILEDKTPGGPKSRHSASSRLPKVFGRRQSADRIDRH